MHSKNSKNSSWIFAAIWAFMKICKRWMLGTAIFPAKVPRVPGFDPALCAALILSFICKLPLSFKNSSCYVSYSFQNSLLVFQKNLKKLNVLVCNRIRTKLHRNSWRLILTSLLIAQAQEILISNIAMGLLWLKFADVCRPPIFKKSDFAMEMSQALHHYGLSSQRSSPRACSGHLHFLEGS